jgi:hypothetical protein
MVVPLSAIASLIKQMQAVADQGEMSLEEALANFAEEDGEKSAPQSKSKKTKK